MKESIPPLYKKIVPLNPVEHEGLFVKDKGRFEYARHIKAVPIVVTEIPRIAPHYEIVFGPEGDAWPYAMLEKEDGTSRYVQENGDWEYGIYIPAFLRRYPFMFIDDPVTEQLTLGIDPAGANGEDGWPLFFPDMRPADITKDVLEFCKSFYAGTWSTERFAKEVDKSGLLKGIEDNGDGLRYIDKVPVMGLSADQWESLDDEQLMKWLVDMFVTGTDTSN